MAGILLQQGFIALNSAKLAGAIVGYSLAISLPWFLSAICGISGLLVGDIGMHYWHDVIVFTAFPEESRSIYTGKKAPTKPLPKEDAVRRIWDGSVLKDTDAMSATGAVGVNCDHAEKIQRHNGPEPGWAKRFRC